MPKPLTSHAARAPQGERLLTQGMLAGEVAKALGVGVQTLHYYEREGLLPPPPRSASGYRLYTPELVERVGFIRRAQALGLPLEEVREVLTLAEEGACPCGRVQAALAEKLAEVDRRLAELHAFRDELAALVAEGGEIARERRDDARVCAIVEHGAALTRADVAHAPLGIRARPGARSRRACATP